MFTQKTKNALRIVSLLLDNKDSEKKMSATDIAKNLELSSPFISKILQQLSRDTIISSSKGRGGGFYLSPDNLEKPILSIMASFDDSIKINQCILGLYKCSDSNPCSMHHFYMTFKTEMKHFSEKKISELNTGIPSLP